MIHYELYPQQNETRTCWKLDGLWRFAFDDHQVGKKEGWMNGLPNSISMPVPGSFQDVFTDRASHDYCGDFWYETEFIIPKELSDSQINIRFGSVTHRGIIYINGQLCGFHEGGYLPFAIDISEFVRKGEKNLLSICANNELSEETLPCGNIKELKDGRKIATPYFDFFNYAGIHRSVYIVVHSQKSIVDFNTDYQLQGKDAKVEYEIFTSCDDGEIEVSLWDVQGKQCAIQKGRKNSLEVKNVHLWKVRDAYLYTMKILLRNGEQIIDEYSTKIGIRTVKVQGTKILINNEPIYLKGFGKHEDFALLGRGFNYSVAKRDFECMKWTNANCFRTSHYPYAEEWYAMADEEGFLIIDEVPAVGMMRSTKNFAKAGQGGFTRFFQTDTVATLLKNHCAQLKEMIQRDKNHPSVFAYSLFNEPETTSPEAREYFQNIFSCARGCDPQSRPLTGALEKNSSPEKCMVYDLCDFICLNRYYGWYIHGGGEIDDAIEQFHEEMNQWKSKHLDVPFLFTEFGTDTLAGQHNLPGIMWSEEYQKEYYQKNFEAFDDYDFIQGELTWNFADFATSEGIMRVNGNKKGVFTRDRQPKSSAYLLKERWSKR